MEEGIRLNTKGARAYGLIDEVVERHSQQNNADHQDATANMAAPLQEEIVCLPMDFTTTVLIRLGEHASYKRVCVYYVC